MKVGFIIAVVFFYVFVGMLALALGFTSPVIENPPSGLPEWTDTFTWIFDVIGSIFQLMFFQVEEIPTMLNTLIFLPLTIGIFFGVMRLIRGGG